MKTAKNEVQSLLNKLPDDCAIEDIQYHLYVIEKIRKGISRANEEGAMSQQDVEKRLNKLNLINITSGWSAAYGMFVKGETPIVLSYVTSSAYHKIVEGEKKYKAAVFEEGHYTQIEFAAMVKKSKKQKLAQTFIDFMLSEDFQKAIPTSNWMYPVITYEKLPSAFDKQPKTLPLLDDKLIAKKQREWLQQWKSAIR